MEIAKDKPEFCIVKRAGASDPISDKDSRMEFAALTPINIDIMEIAKPAPKRIVVGLHFRLIL